MPTLIVFRSAKNCQPTADLITRMVSKFLPTYFFLIQKAADHLPQFLVAPEIFRNSPSNRSNYFEGDWNNFNQENFILDYFPVNWRNINLQKNDINHSLKNFFDSMNDLLKIHDPFKMVKKI